MELHLYCKTGNFMVPVHHEEDPLFGLKPVDVFTKVLENFPFLHNEWKKIPTNIKF